MIALKIGRRWIAKARRRIAQREREEMKEALTVSEVGTLDAVQLTLPPRHQKYQTNLNAHRNDAHHSLQAAGIIATPSSVRSAMLWNGLKARADTFETAAAHEKAMVAVMHSGAMPPPTDNTSGPET